MTGFFPSTGQTLVSSALDAEQMQTVFQQITSNVLGLANSLPFTAVLVNGQNTISVSSTVGVSLGDEITDNPGFGVTEFGVNPDVLVSLIPQGTKITNINGLVLTLSKPVTGSATTTVYVTTPAANTAVRSSWQQQGAPAWGVDEDVCFVRCEETTNEYSTIRDETISQNDDETVTATRTYTRVWSVHWSTWGPRCMDHMRQIISALLLEVTTTPLSFLELFIVPELNSPYYSKEADRGQWWQRTLFKAEFYEQVTETITNNIVTSVEVIVENAVLEPSPPNPPDTYTAEVIVENVQASPSGPKFADDEIPTMQINGTFKIAHAPAPPSSLILSAYPPESAGFGSTVLYADTDYTLSGSVITIINGNVYTTGQLRAWYRY